MQNRKIICILDLQKYDRQIAGNAQRPQGRLGGRAFDNLPGWRTQARVITCQHAAQGLKIGGSCVRNSQMSQLHLCLGPGQGGGARKCRCIAVAIHQIKQRIRRRGNHGPECDPGHAPRWNADPAANGKNRV